MEGNRIRLSRKAILKEQRAKMGGGEAPPDGGGGGEGEGHSEPAATPALTIEGGGDFPDEPEPNFNRDAPFAGAGERAPDRPDRGPGGGRPGGGPGGGGGGRRRGGGGGGGRGGPRGGHGGGHGGPRH